MRRFALVLLAAPLAAQAPAQRAFTPADWYKVTNLSSPAMSPDGRRVAFTVTTVDERNNRRHSEVWWVATAGGAPVRLTSPSTESSNPRWSPDGTRLYFTSNRPGGRGTTWVLRVDEPAGEAFQIDSLPPANASVTRDGRLFVFAAAADADSAPRGPAAGGAGGAAPARAPFGAITRPLDQARFDGRHYVQFPIKSNGPGYLANPATARVARPQQLFTQAAGATARTQLTRTAYSHQAPVVSPDGQWIAFVADAELRPDSVVQAIADSLALLPYDRARDEAPRNDRDIYVIPATGGEPRKVASLQGEESQLAWSPDGKRLAYIGRTTRTSNARLMVVDVAGGTPVSLTDGWQYEPSVFDWLPGGDLLMEASIGGRSAVYRVDVKRRTMTEVIGGRRVLRGLSTDRAMKQLAFVATSVTQPTELYVAGIDGRNERKLTAFNDALNAQVAWADAERFTYPSVGGVSIEGWLMKPFGYDPARKYPVVLYIHGGPHSQYNEGWFDEFQNLAGAGMFVLYTNPRGSSGYGAEFTYSTRGRWFAEDYQDLMTAVDVVARRPDVDSTRMGVTGGSYGGVMTAWVTAKTARFKAAQADRMISNWWSWYGSSDAQGLTEFEFFGRPWDNPAMYDTLSPIRYLRQVKTPTLIVQSEEDHRTPMTDAEQWFVGLRKQGTPAELVRYPRSTHDLSRTGEPWLLVDRLGRLRQWFGYWLNGEMAGEVRATR
jgi:dipeptidyl aminopeptidase/acylaminoacyl peptidase